MLRKKVNMLILVLLAMALMAPASVMGEPVKNVIVMIPDGCSFEHYTLARWFKGSPLAMDRIMVGAVGTYISDSVVADSAPAASAYATGVRTSDKFISVTPKAGGMLPPEPPPAPGEEYRPRATVLEAAKRSGRAVGVVATSRVTHATPAAFISHVASRALEDDIMEQAVYQNLDLAFGGGGRHLLPKDEAVNLYNEPLAEDPHTKQWAGKGKRPDKENLLEVLHGRGYTIITNKDELAALDQNKVFGMFNLSHMSTEIDRPASAPAEPTLQEMTAKALDILSKDPDGFFLMVEGSQVDWASHANDPGYLLSDLLMFEKAVETVLQFAEKDGQTLVLVMPDHNTGGLTIGNTATDNTYSQTKLDALLDPLKKITASAGSLVMRIGDEKTPEKVKSVVKEFWGMDITDQDANDILAKMAEYKSDPGYAFGEILSARYTYLGWTTHGHCGGDVPLGAFGPGRPVGRFFAPEIGNLAAEAMGLDLEAVTDELYQNPAKALEGSRIQVDKSNPNNPVVKVVYQDQTFEPPANKNFMKKGDKIEPLDGLIVYISENDQVYVPQSAIKLMAGQQ